jgi:hypothetical protein
MCPDHPRWEEFLDRLLYGLDLKTDGNDEQSWTCAHEPACPLATLLLDWWMGFTPEEIHASIEYFHAHGGFCDCEVFFNVEQQSSREVR